MSHHITAAVGPHVLASAVVLLLLRPTIRLARDPEAVMLHETIGRPVGRLSVASYTLGYADRYVIQLIAGTVPLGIYTLGYQLGEGALELVSSPVTNALLPRVISEWSDDDAERGRRLAFTTVRRGGIVIVGVSALAVPAVFLADRLGLLRVVSPAPELPAIMAIVAVAVGLQGLTRLAYGLLLAQGRPAEANRCFWQVVALSALTVPLATAAWGIVGTAAATLVGYGVLAGLMIRVARRETE
jgi:O-antigen/teichoic acid export membrane protein